MTEIIKVDFRADPDRDIEPALRVRRREQMGCLHAQTVVDEKLRRLSCKDCSETLDPIEFIADWAKDWARYADEVKYLRLERDQRRGELAQLLRRARNLRADPARLEAAAAGRHDHRAARGAADPTARAPAGVEDARMTPAILRVALELTTASPEPPAVMVVTVNGKTGVFTWKGRREPGTRTPIYEAAS